MSAEVAARPGYWWRQDVLFAGERPVAHASEFPGLVAMAEQRRRGEERLVKRRPKAETRR